MISDSKILKITKIFFAGQLFFNVTSAFLSPYGGGVNNASYALRILFILYISKCILSLSYPSILRSNTIYLYGTRIPIFLSISLFYSILCYGNPSALISKIFPTFFLLLEGLLFLSIGYHVEKNTYLKEKVFDLFRKYAVISCIWMTLLSGYIMIFMGGLQSFWDTARHANHTYDIVLNVYKNVNPYRFAIFIPFFFLKRNRWNIPLVVMSCVNILAVGKKGPLLAIALSGLIVFIFNKQGKLKFIKYLSVAFLLFYVYITFIDTNIFDAMLYRLDMDQHYQDDKTTFYMSGRNTLWDMVLTSFLSGSIVNKTLGFGVDAVGSYLMAAVKLNNAHNDWVEILYNYGIVGFLIYAFFFISVTRSCWSLKYYNTKYFLTSLYLVCFSFVSTFYTVESYGGLAAPGYGFVLFSFICGCKKYIQSVGTERG